MKLGGGVAGGKLDPDGKRDFAGDRVAGWMGEVNLKTDLKAGESTRSGWIMATRR
jgi:hypothetical protein